MTYKRWGALMLFLPLLVPAILFMLVDIYDYQAVMEGTGRLAHLFFVSSLIAALPYLFFSIAVTLWCWHRPVMLTKKIRVWLPWAFAPLCGLFFFVGFGVIYPDGDAGKAAAFLMAFCVPVGFLYVLVVHFLTLLVQHLKFVEDINAQP